MQTPLLEEMYMMCLSDVWKHMVNSFSHLKAYLTFLRGEGRQAACFTGLQDPSFPTRNWTWAPSSGSRVLITGPPGSLHILLFYLTYMTGNLPSNSRNDHTFTIPAFICLSANSLFLFSFRVCAWQTERAQSELEIQSCLCYWFIRNHFVRVHLWNCFLDSFYLLLERFFFFFWRVKMMNWNKNWPFGGTNFLRLKINMYFTLYIFIYFWLYIFWKRPREIYF